MRHFRSSYIIIKFNRSNDEKRASTNQSVIDECESCTVKRNIYFLQIILEFQALPIHFPKKSLYEVLLDNGTLNNVTYIDAKSTRLF